MVLGEGLEAANDARRRFPRCLPDSEVRSIARSSARYSLRQYDREKFIETRRQRGKAGGKASGAKRRAGSIEGAAPWKAQGVSRATRYRRRETGSINR